VCQKRILGNTLDLKYEPLTCLKNYPIVRLKAMIFLKLKFDLSKNALAHDPGPQLNLIPGAGLFLLIETRCAHARG
jgi:hypothetical protein